MNNARMYCGNDDPSPDMMERAAKFFERASKNGSQFRRPSKRLGPKVTNPAAADYGLGKMWLDAFRDFKEDRCILFPFRTAAQPRGGVTYNFRRMEAHRAMCLMAHGLPKDANKAMALHTCGNGHLGCVSPAHLYWGDQSNNSKDAHRHADEGKAVANDSRSHSRIGRHRPYAA